jgi:hypothetical protein
MKVVQCVLGFTRSARVVDDAALLKGRCIHTLLNILDEGDVLDLQHSIEVLDCRLFGLVRLRRL